MVKYKLKQITKTEKERDNKLFMILMVKKLMNRNSEMIKKMGNM